MPVKNTILPPGIFCHKINSEKLLRLGKYYNKLFVNPVEKKFINVRFTVNSIILLVSIPVTLDFEYGYEIFIN